MYRAILRPYPCLSQLAHSLAAGDLDQQVQELIQQNQALTDRLMQVEDQLSGMKAAPETVAAEGKPILSCGVCAMDSAVGVTQG